MSTESKGHILVEILLAIAIFTVIATAILGGFVSARDGKVSQKQNLLAKGYLDQAVEALRNVRERDWSLVPVSGVYHPTLNTSTWGWELTAGTENVDGFTRRVDIYPVYRAMDTGEFVSTGGFLDPASRKAVITVSWGLLDQQKLTLTQFITRYHRNESRFHTLESDFNDGVFVGTALTTDYGNGEIVLGAGGKGNWCKPGQSVMAEQDLEGQGVANSISALEGLVYGGTGQNSSGKSLSKVEVSQDNPPQASVAGTLDGYKTNSLFGEENYVYIATDTNDEEVAIISTSGGSYTKVGWVNAPGVSDASGVFVVGDVGYVINGTNFSTFDLSSRTGNRSIKKTVTLPGNGNSLVVVEDYAYVATSSSSKELQIVNVSDSNNPVLEGYADLSGGTARDVFVNSTGTRVYLVTSLNGGNEIFIVNTDIKTGSRSVKASSGSGSMDPKAITVVPGNKAIIVGSGGEEYQAFNIVEDAEGNISLSKCGGLDFTFDINDIASVLEGDGDAFSYIATSDASNEIKIIEGGPGGNYATEGTFESEVIDNFAGDVQFNRFETDFDKPEGASIRLQVAVFQPVDGSCSNVISPPYIGPDGTNASFFEQSASVPFYSEVSEYTNPGKCFRYKLFLASNDPNMSPVFKSIKVNLSL